MNRKKKPAGDLGISPASRGSTSPPTPGAERSTNSTHAVVIGATMLHHHEIALVLQPHDIELNLVDAADSQVHSPDLVVVNFEKLTNSAPSEVRKARQFGVPVLCCIPANEADNVLIIEQMAADDYLLTPYRLEDMVCRIRLLSRKAAQDRLPDIERRHGERRVKRGPWPNTEAAFAVPILTIDDHKKLIVLGGREMHLTPKEYSLFCLLASDPERIFSNEEIIEHIWPTSQRATVLDVQQFVHLLRKKVEVNPKRPEFILTVKGFGYKLELPHPAQVES